MAQNVKQLRVKIFDELSKKSIIFFKSLAEISLMFIKLFTMPYILVMFF